jgi:multiple sugar transport system permease protein
MSTINTQARPAVVTVGQSKPGRRVARRSGLAGYGFVSLYAILLTAFGVLPTFYAIYLALTNADGQFVGLGQFIRTAQDFRFPLAFLNAAGYVVIWLVVLLVMTVGLALILHQRARAVSSAFRFVFYLPGALVGVAGILVWLFMLDPAVSPASGLLNALGFTSFTAVIAPGNLATIFVIMAFWTGAGGWIVVMYGALNNIPLEIMDAARVDGASTWQIAWRIQIPMIKQWIAYMAILAFAGGTQIFAEPQLVYNASGSGINPTWSPNQLAYSYAFDNNDFNGAAAISLYLLVIGLAAAALIVSRTGLFSTKDDA